MAERTSSWPGRHIATTYPSAMWHVPEGAAQANRNTSSTWMPTVAAIQQSVFNFLFLAQSALFLAQLFLNFSLHFPTQFRIRLCFPYVTRTWHQQRVALSLPLFYLPFVPCLFSFRWSFVIVAQRDTNSLQVFNSFSFIASRSRTRSRAKSHLQFEQPLINK